MSIRVRWTVRLLACGVAVILLAAYWHSSLRFYFYPVSVWAVREPVQMTCVCWGISGATLEIDDPQELRVVTKMYAGLVGGFPLNPSTMAERDGRLLSPDVHFDAYVRLADGRRLIGWWSIMPGSNFAMYMPEETFDDPDPSALEIPAEVGRDPQIVALQTRIMKFCHTH